MLCCSDASTGPCTCRYQSSRLPGRARQVRGGAGRAAASGGQQSLGSRAPSRRAVRPGAVQHLGASATSPGSQRAQRVAFGNAPSLLLQARHARPCAKTATPRGRCLHGVPSIHSSRRGAGWPGRPGERATLRRFRDGAFKAETAAAGAKALGQEPAWLVPGTREWVWQEARSWER